METIKQIRKKFFPLKRSQRQVITVIVLMLNDAAMLALAFWLGSKVRFQVLPYFSQDQLPDFLLFSGSTIALWLLLFAIFQLYNVQHLFEGLEEYTRVFNAVSVGTLVLVAVGFFTREDLLISRGWLLITWALSILFVAISRMLLRGVVYAFRRRGHLLSPALIIGANDEALALAERLQNWDASGLYLTGFISDGHRPGEQVYNGYRILGSLADLETVVTETGVEEMIVAPTAVTRRELLEIFRKFTHRPDVNVRLSSGLFEILATGLRVREFASVPLIEIKTTRITGLYAVLKTILDYVITIPLLILISPLLLTLILIVRLDSPGPAIYRRRVLGVNGREFDAFKFRTMVVNGDEILEAHPNLKERLVRTRKLVNDPRVTRVGRAMRKYSLDEFPQLFNVLLGQMSLVGPRSIAPEEVGEYGKWDTNLLTVKPGLTGLWQVSGRSDLSYEERVRLDMHYIRNWTIWLDIFLLLRTIPVVLRGQGAY